MTSCFASVFSYFVPPALEANPDDRRRARLIVGFSLLGAFFGTAFGAFYMLIGHYWGAAIIGVCCTLFGIVPHLMRHGRSSIRAGNHYCLILLAGFLCLSWVEGGMHGHAVAWLVIVPLCALLLTSQKGAIVWSICSFLAATITCGIEAFGISPPFGYPQEWHVIVSTLGYSSLVMFLFLLGMIFENGRREAHNRMQHFLDQLGLANIRLTQLNEEKSEFLGIAAHDLKNPLTVVMGCSELIANGAPPERVQRSAIAILKEAQRMRALITDLLDLNAIEEGRLNLNPRAIDLQNATDSLLENQRALAAKKAIALRINAASNVIAIADEKALLQILENLLSNAIKFTKPGGQVGFDCWEDFEHAWIKVSDSGPGISAEDQAKMFSRFTKLTARPTGGESSHGLGLSIVKRLADAMDGTIRCESALGKGTSFILRLKKASPAERATAEPKTEPLPTAVELPQVPPRRGIDIPAAAKPKDV